MNMREKLNVTAYFIVGPENSLGRPVANMIRAAVVGGFTTVQIRSKEASAREMIQLCREGAQVLKELRRSDTVALLVNDRLDVALAAREAGIKVDGIHVGQNDIPPAVCRKYLGDDAIVGLSAHPADLIDYVKNDDVSVIDYFGVGPWHKTDTKPDAGLTEDGQIVTRTDDELYRLRSISPVPIVVGGGVKLHDVASIAYTGVAGFFVISAIAGSDKPLIAAREMSCEWYCAQKAMEKWRSK